jgi:NAD(P)-dependent dehydrogenase (short-subunit alcohol dehydrogenase family)
LILDAFKLEGKTALVTGASAGLGAAIAVALAEAGADVACHGNTRSPDATMLDEEVILIDIFSPVREDFLNLPQPNGDGQMK